MNELGDMVRLALSGALIGAGVVALIISAAGLLRFPDFYTRLHANAAADLLGVVATLAGLALAAWDWQTALRLGVLGVLFGALTPAATHMLASAAHGAGLAPLSGAYTAPRPGERAR